MCRWLGAALLLFIATRMYTTAPAHVSWRGVTQCKKGNTTLTWSLQQRHVDDLTDGTTVIAHLRVDCWGDARVHWTHTTHTTCPIDITSIHTYPPTVVLETEHPQRIRSQLDMVKLHDVPKLTKWMSL